MLQNNMVKSTSMHVATCSSVNKFSEVMLNQKKDIDMLGKFIVGNEW